MSATCQALKDGLSDLADVVTSFAQRGYAQLDDIDAVIKVLAELALCHQIGEALVRRREYAHVNSFFARLADGAHGLLLDDA